MLPAPDAPSNGATDKLGCSDVQAQATSDGIVVPDVDGLTLANTALAYAACGWYLLPTRPDDIKSPGSVVGGRWYDKSSRDPEQIREWWTDNPDYGIALHCGRSGLIAFDFDRNSLDDIASDGRPDIAEALRSAGAIHLTRREGDRGHYLFLMPELPDGRQFGNSAGQFMRWGQVRGKNGVIILEPTPHPSDGYYHWKRSGR